MIGPPCFKDLEGAAEVAQLAKCQPCKHKDHRPDPQYPCTKSDAMVCVPILSGLELKTGGYLDVTGGNLAESMSPELETWRVMEKYT